MENVQSTWQTAVILIARLIFAAMFAMGVAFKLMDIGATAGYIAAAGFPFPLFLAWCAAILETLLVIAFLTGALLTPAALIGAVYVTFLGFAFHGPSHWAGNQAEFGAFMAGASVRSASSTMPPCTSAPASSSPN